MTLAWFKYYGVRLGLNIKEVPHMRYGEMMDMMNCDAVFNGAAEIKQTAHRMSFDDAMKLR